MTVTATRYHDISCGHRVTGHEGKCAHLHGHNYRVHFTVEAEERDSCRPGADAPGVDHFNSNIVDGTGVDHLGRVLDFTSIKHRLCNWLESNWDHGMLIWTHDPWINQLAGIDPQGIVEVSFNPTAENMAKYLVEVVGPRELAGTGVRLISVTIDETRKCSATYSLKGNQNAVQDTVESGACPIC